MTLGGSVAGGSQGLVLSGGMRSLDLEHHGAGGEGRRGADESSGLTGMGIGEEELMWVTRVEQLPEIKTCAA